VRESLRFDDSDKALNAFNSPYLERANGELVFIGPIAHEIMEQLIEGALSYLSLDSVIDRDDFKEVVKQSLVKLLEESPDSRIKINDLLHSVKTEVDKGTSDCVVIVPFVGSALLEKGASITIGKVKIYSRDIFTTAHAQKILGKFRSESDSYEVDALRHYENFNWFIEVPIDNVYSSSLRDRHALNTATLIMNLFMLQYSSLDMNQMAVGFNIPTNNDSYTIEVVSGGETQTKSVTTWRGVVTDERFLERFLEHHRNHFEILEKAVLLQLDHVNYYPFFQRFADSLYWYGDARREENSTVSMVKLVTALERLLMFNEKNISAKIQSRAVALLIHTGVIERSKAIEYQEAIRTAYKLRSDILHGKLSPTQFIKMKSLINTSVICKDVILTFLMYMSESLTSVESELKLGNHLDNLAEKYQVKVKDKVQKYCTN